MLERTAGPMSFLDPSLADAQGALFYCPAICARAADRPVLTSGSAMECACAL